MFFSFGHNSPLSAKFSENIKQKQGDDAEWNQPYKHHNNLPFLNLARRRAPTMLIAAQNRGEATPIAHQLFADVVIFANRRSKPGPSEILLKTFATAPIRQVKFIRLLGCCAKPLGGAHN
jgi:hypothetical protein